MMFLLILHTKQTPGNRDLLKRSLPPPPHFDSNNRILRRAGRELEAAYEAAKADPKFHEEVAWYRREYIGGPTPMYHAKRLSAEMGGAQVWWLSVRASDTSPVHAIFVHDLCYYFHTSM